MGQTGRQKPVAYPTSGQDFFSLFSLKVQTTGHQKSLFGHYSLIELS